MKARAPLLGLVALLVLGLGWLLLAPVPIQPVAWTPPANPLGSFPYTSNGLLAGLERIELDGAGPEDIEVLPDQTVLAGLADGRIVRWRGGSLDTLADTGGRPLGLVRALQGGLWVADAERGLLHVSSRGRVTPVVSEHQGQPLRFVNDVDISPDGWVYFTEADHRWGFADLERASLEAGAHGRLLRYRPPTTGVAGGELQVVLDGLHFANGVAVGANGAYLVLAETLRTRILRVWLDEDRLGQAEPILEGLPGFPDNVTSAGRGVFWVALYTPRTALKDAALASPGLRRLADRLPDGLFTSPRRYPMAVAFNSTGRVLQFLDDPDGAYAPLTSITEHGSYLWLGSLSERSIGRVRAPLRIR